MNQTRAKPITAKDLFTALAFITDNAEIRLSKDMKPITGYRIYQSTKRTCLLLEVGR